MVKTEFYEIKIEDGILIGKYAKDSVLTEEIVMNSIMDRLRFTKDNSYPFLLDPSEIKYATLKAMQAGNCPEGKYGIDCVALLVKNEVIKILAIFFMRMIGSADFPIRIFSTFSEAKDWLQTEKKKKIERTKEI
jgi:hypothetical protein